ncbi:MAG: tetratricopeptide repeat protein [Bacteriovoracia bacterium]
MIRSKNDNNILILLLALALYGGALFIHKKFERPKIVVSKQDSAVNLSRGFLHIASLGNKRLFSSFIWVQTLLESDLEKYKGKDLNSWMYLRFKTIASLDPRFYENYLFGGMFLSIVKDDLEGAADIFESGLKYYPRDYKLNYNAGFNYYFEMGDFEKGLEKLQLIENHPDAPEPLASIVSKLKFETKQDFDSTLVLLKQRYDLAQSEGLKKKVASEIYAVKAERDLKCLNEGGNNCDRTDARGESYVYKNGTWVAIEDFKLYRIKRRANQKAPEKSGAQKRN